MMKTLAKHPVPERHDFRFWGSGTTDPPLARDLFRVQGLGWFGMTETIGFPTIGHLDLPNRPLGMGAPAPGYEVEVRRDDGSPVANGETGRLVVRGIPGLSLFHEYLNNPRGDRGRLRRRGLDGDGRPGDAVSPTATCASRAAARTCCALAPRTSRPRRSSA